MWMWLDRSAFAAWRKMTVAANSRPSNNGRNRGYRGLAASSREEKAGKHANQGNKGTSVARDKRPGSRDLQDPRVSKGHKVNRDHKGRRVNKDRRLPGRAGSSREEIGSRAIGSREVTGNKVTGRRETVQPVETDNRETDNKDLHARIPRAKTLLKTRSPAFNNIQIQLPGHGRAILLIPVIQCRRTIAQQGNIFEPGAPGLVKFSFCFLQCGWIHQ